MRRSLVCVVILALGCRSGTAPAASVQGTWTEDGKLPGASLRFDLTQRGTTVTGSGRYSIEAGRSGDVQVSGSFVASTVTLDLTYDYGSNAAFTGKLVDAHQLSGTVTNGTGPGIPESFTRP